MFAQDDVFTLVVHQVNLKHPPTITFQLNKEEGVSQSPHIHVPPTIFNCTSVPCTLIKLPNRTACQICIYLSLRYNLAHRVRYSSWGLRAIFKARGPLSI